MGTEQICLNPTGGKMFREADHELEREYSGYGGARWSEGWEGEGNEVEGQGRGEGQGQGEPGRG